MVKTAKSYHIHIDVTKKTSLNLNCLSLVFDQETCISSNPGQTHFLWDKTTPTVYQSQWHNTVFWKSDVFITWSNTAWEWAFISIFICYGNAGIFIILIDVWCIFRSPLRPIPDVSWIKLWGLTTFKTQQNKGILNNTSVPGNPRQWTLLPVPCREP